MLTLKNITKTYKVGAESIDAIKEVTLCFRKAEFVTVVGPSGCGKTTLLNVIGGLDVHTSGDLMIENKSTRHFKDRDWDGYRNDSIGFVFQNYHLIPHLTVFENVEMALLLSGKKRKERKERVNQVLQQVGILDQTNKLPKQLSGGQMQRVAIARALVNDPQIVLADEPTGALDSKTALQIVEILKQISKTRLVIMVTHNEGLANQFSMRKIHLLDGRVIDDTHPYLEELDQALAKNKKTSMPFFTAIALSFKNLITKKLRSALTVIAGSVGIIGVSLVLAIANSVNVYMEDIQKATLSNYPITIRSTTQETDYFEPDPRDFKIYPDDNQIYVVNLNQTYYGHVNVFSENFLQYLKGLDKSLYNIVDYRTNIDMKIITQFHDQYRRIGVAQFREMSEDIDYLATQYDVLHGKLPQNKNEIAILVDRYNRIDVSILNQLGINYQGINEYSFQEMTEKEYRIILNNDFYYQLEDGRYAAVGSAQYETLYQQASTSLHIVGILRISPLATTNIYESGILYTQALTQYIIDDSLESDIVVEQLSHGLDRNVFTLQPFEDDEYLTATISKEYKYEQQLATLTAQSQINMIRIYTDRFASRSMINDYLKAYNDDKDNEDQILYSDFMGTITREFDAFIAILTQVLIAFAAVSLFVSTVMIGIITYVSVMERIKEIGILRSLGARKIDIANVFNAETTIIGFFAGVLGVIIGTALLQPIISIFTNILEANNITTFDLSLLQFTHMNILYALALVFGSVMLTLFAGFAPAILASLKSPVEAIKTE